MLLLKRRRKSNLCFKVRNFKQLPLELGNTEDDSLEDEPPIQINEEEEPEEPKESQMNETHPNAILFEQVENSHTGPAPRRRF